MEYNKKVTYWNHKEEILLYDTPIKINKRISKKNKRTKYENMSSRERKVSDTNRIKYYRKRVRKIIDLSIENELYTTITLTFKDEITDYKQAQKAWDLFLKRLKYDVGKDFKYIATHEIQKRRGDVFHFHVLCNLGYFPVEKLNSIWNNGFVFIRQIKSDDEETKKRQLQYEFKYIVKDILDDCKNNERDKARKIYLSRNLKRPVVEKVMSYETVEDIIFENMERVEHTCVYDVRNYRSEKINEVDAIILRKE